MVMTISMYTNYNIINNIDNDNSKCRLNNNFAFSTYPVLLELTAWHCWARMALIL